MDLCGCIGIGFFYFFYIGDKVVGIIKVDIVQDFFFGGNVVVQV